MRIENGLSHVACVVFCLCLSCDGCRKKRDAPGAVVKAEQAGPKRKLSRREATQKLLQMIPADNVALVALDVRALYRMLGDLEAALKHTAPGKELLRLARQGAAGAPVRVPWGVKELAGLGLDPDGVAAAFGKGEPSAVVLPIKDRSAFKRQAALLVKANTSAWKTVERGGRTLYQIAGTRGSACCHFAGARATCAATREHLLAALDERRQRSVWDTLPADMRNEVERISLLLYTSWEGGQTTAALRVMADGVSVDVRTTDKDLLRVVLSFASETGDRGSLLGLARGASSVVCLRLNLMALLITMPVLSVKLQELGIEPKALMAALTGEVLVVERPGRSPVLLLETRDRAASAALVTRVAAALKGMAKKQRGRGSRLEVTRHRGKGTVFRLRLRPPRGKEGGLDLRLALGPGAVLLGKAADVQALAAATGAPPAVAAFRQTLEASEDRAAFAPGLILASRSLLRDPFGSVPGPEAVEQMIGAGHFPNYIKQGFEVIRFLYDQLNHQTLGIVKQKDGGLRLVLRLTTLHRHGNAGDDKARAIYIKGLEARRRGMLATHDMALRLLKKEHGGSRYGGLLDRKPGGLSGPVVLLGAAAAVALPAYLRRPKAGGAAPTPAPPPPGP